MFTRVERLKAEDLEHIIDRGGTSYVGRILTVEQVEALESADYSYSVFVNDQLRICAGVAEYWNGRGESWAVIDPNIGVRDFMCAHYATKRFLSVCPIRRIEASVKVGFEAGHRWVKALGFKLEAENLEGFLPDGSAASLYSVVRSG